jgi:DNA repair protein RadC
MELLLTYALPRKDTKPAARALLRKFGSVSAALEAGRQELREISGVGDSAALFINLLCSVMRKCSLERAKRLKAINNPLDIADFCGDSLRGEKNEVLEVIYLNAYNAVIGAQRLSEGAADGVNISPAKILEKALMQKAAGLILLHNHPSGEIEPSKEDIAFTASVSKAAAALGIMLVDHIIAGERGLFSVKASCVIKTYD